MGAPGSPEARPYLDARFGGDAGVAPPHARGRATGAAGFALVLGGQNRGRTGAAGEDPLTVTGRQDARLPEGPYDLPSWRPATVQQYRSNAAVRSAAMSGAGRPSMFFRSSMKTSFPLLNSAICGEEGGYPVK